MQLTDFRDILLTADSAATKWKSASTGNYTVWYPFMPIVVMADGDVAEDGWRIQVDRFTKNPDDLMIDDITSALRGNNEIAITVETITFEPDTGYFHFIWICEVA